MIIRIPLYPSTRLGRHLYMAVALMAALGAFTSARDGYKLAAALDARARTAEVLPVDGYTERYDKLVGLKVTRSRTTQLSFLDAEGVKHTMTSELDAGDVDTLRAGGRLRVEYLPGQPGSARLEGHRPSVWLTALLGAFCLLYAYAMLG